MAYDAYKAELHKKILKLLKEWEEETGLRVERVETKHSHSLGGVKLESVYVVLEIEVDK
jgi:hypothetical protein